MYNQQVVNITIGRSALSKAVDAVKSGMDVQEAASTYKVSVEEINQELQSGLNGNVAEEEGVGDLTSFSNVPQNEEDSDSSLGWALGLGTAVAATAGLVFRKKLGVLSGQFSKIENWLNLRKMKSMHAVQLEDGSYYAQSLIETKNGKRITTHLKQHIQDTAKEMERNPWSGNWSKTLQETRYNPNTGLMETLESNGGRFSTLTSTSASGERVYTAISADGSIVYRGYDKNFRAIPGVEQSVTCLDKEGNVIKEFKGSEISFAKHSRSDYSQDRSAIRALDVKSLEYGPLSVDRYSVGDFNNLVRTMNGQVYQGSLDIIRNASYKAKELVEKVPCVTDAKKVLDEAVKTVEQLEARVKGSERELHILSSLKEDVQRWEGFIERFNTTGRLPKPSTRFKSLADVECRYAEYLEKFNSAGGQAAYEGLLNQTKELETARRALTNAESAYQWEMANELLKLPDDVLRGF